MNSSIYHHANQFLILYKKGLNTFSNFKFGIEALIFLMNKIKFYFVKLNINWATKYIYKHKKANLQE